MTDLKTQFVIGETGETSDSFYPSWAYLITIAFFQTTMINPVGTFCYKCALENLNTYRCGMRFKAKIFVFPLC